MNTNPPAKSVPFRPPPPVPAMDVRAIIRRGQRRDRMFSILGLSLVVGSLAVLLVLLGKLVYDGGPMLVHKQEVLKSTGMAPKIVPVPDVVGTVTQVPGPDGKPAWLITPRAIKLDLVRYRTKDDKPPTPAEALAAIDKVKGQRVVLEGALITDPSGGRIEPEDVKPAPVDDKAFAADAKIRRQNYVGFLREEKDLLEHRDVLNFYQDLMTLDLSKAENPIPLAEGMKVAVSPGRDLRKLVGTIAVREIDQVQEKSFFTSMPASAWYRAGVYSGWVGSLVVMVVTLLTALPLGVAAGVYLEEYAPKNWLTSMIEVNISNLAGVPSIVWGLLGLGLFVYGVQAGHSVLAAGLTLGLLVLPIIIIATREAIRAIPSTIRDASIALGATKWETTWHHVLPYSMGGILTGSIVALSRAIGETAPLIVVGAAVFLTDLPSGPRSPFTVLPIQMFEWTSRPEKEFQRNAAAAGIILIVMTLLLNSVAIYMRARLRKAIKW